MNAERIRDFLLGLPHVVETEQWGGLVFWVGDKAIGGKMFVMLNLEQGQLPISYPVGPERYNDRLELEGLRPAPYMARIFWVAAEHWDVHRNAMWESELTAAHALTYAKLPPKALKVLALGKAEQKRIIAEKRRERKAKAS
jgi:predicted DNA-binding protein (MmcQ/YjbR family)